MLISAFTLEPFEKYRATKTIFFIFKTSQIKFRYENCHGEFKKKTHFFHFKEFVRQK